MGGNIGWKNDKKWRFEVPLGLWGKTGNFGCLAYLTFGRDNFNVYVFDGILDKMRGLDGSYTESRVDRRVAGNMMVRTGGLGMKMLIKLQLR